MFWISNIYSDYSEADFGIYLNVAKKVGLKFFLFGHALRPAGSLFPKQELDLCPLAVEVWSANHWTAREVPRVDLKNSHHKKKNF